MQKHCELPGNCHDRSFLGVLAPSFSDPLPVTSKIAVRPSRTKYVMSTGDQKLPEIAVSGFRDTKLGFKQPRSVLSGDEPQKRTDDSASPKTRGVFKR